MRNLRPIIALMLAGIALMSCGCLKTSITDSKIIDAVQAYLDKPADPADENLLTPEERAAVESFEIYRNILKLQLVEGTDHHMWEPVGTKVARAFAMACREFEYLENTYVVEERIMAELEGKKDNFLIGQFTFVNRSERVTVELYNITRNR